MSKGSSSAQALGPSALRPLLEEALERFLPAVDTPPEPLHRALRYAVFAGGKRVRPEFLLQVAQACGAALAGHELALRAACAVEFIHVASLVHDDLPCFDNAAERRGRPTVHVLFGEARALLVGDALLSRGFEILAAAPRAVAARSLRIVQLLARATGASSGLVCGQGLEHDGTIGLTEGAARYHGAKTGALFRMAAEAAAIAAGAAAAAAWAEVGWLVGRGYTLAHTLTTLENDRTKDARRALDVGAGRGPLAQRGPDAALRTELRALLASVRERIHALAAEPLPLLAFLEALCEPLLQPAAAAPSSVRPGEAAHPECIPALRTEAEPV